jgi:hypothetical protein
MDRERTRMEINEMKYLRTIASYRKTDNKLNDDITGEFDIFN